MRSSFPVHDICKFRRILKRSVFFHAASPPMLRIHIAAQTRRNFSFSAAQCRAIAGKSQHDPKNAMKCRRTACFFFFLLTCRRCRCMLGAETQERSSGYGRLFSSFYRRDGMLNMRLPPRMKAAPAAIHRFLCVRSGGFLLPEGNMEENRLDECRKIINEVRRKKLSKCNNKGKCRE